MSWYRHDHRPQHTLSALSFIHNTWVGWNSKWSDTLMYTVLPATTAGQSSPFTANQSIFLSSLNSSYQPQLSLSENFFGLLLRLTLSNSYSTHYFAHSLSSLWRTIVTHYVTVLLQYLTVLASLATHSCQKRDHAIWYLLWLTNFADDDDDDNAFRGHFVLKVNLHCDWSNCWCAQGEAVAQLLRCWTCRQQTWIRVLPESTWVTGCGIRKSIWSKLFPCTRKVTIFTQAWPSLRNGESAALKGLITVRVCRFVMCL